MKDYREVLEALLAGKKIRSSNWEPHEYVCFDKKGNLINERWIICYPLIHIGDANRWSIYEEPKEEPKEEQLSFKDILKRLKVCNQCKCIFLPAGGRNICEGCEP